MHSDVPRNAVPQGETIQPHAPLLSSDFLRALLDAEHYHRDQVRKQTEIPYVSHVLGVCSIVLEAGGTEVEAIAALLHDAPEDCGGKPILRAIAENYGKQVGDIVEACSDAFPEKGAEKLDWLTRKKQYLAHLGSVGAATMLVSSADKLHNLRAIYADHGKIGENIWDRFNAPAPKREHVLWYYTSLRDIYASAHSPNDSRRDQITHALSELLDRLGYNRDFVPSGAA